MTLSPQQSFPEALAPAGAADRASVAHDHLWREVRAGSLQYGSYAHYECEICLVRWSV